MSLDHSSHTVTNMRLHILLGFCLVATAFAQYVEEDYFLYDSFPPNFKFGYATASYQIEGGWNEDGEYIELENVKFNLSQELCMYTTFLNRQRSQYLGHVDAFEPKSYR